ncbi:MAG: type II toxin-antitoxin system Phd/YefM family antitoxin [Candidatus Electrothrix sp. AR1]|nr:type II toxin-antitoxin system Phd/YefM family antitoxin [Candidatus Electrothrix sp. AR1]
MSITTISCTALTRDIGKTKKAAQSNPIIITERDQPAYVLMTIEQYKKIVGNVKNILDLLAMPDAEDIELTPPRMQDSVCEPADIS